MVKNVKRGIKHVPSGRYGKVAAVIATREMRHKVDRRRLEFAGLEVLLLQTPPFTLVVLLIA